jgi:hypothetical protein
MYKITNYSYKRADELGVAIVPSTKKNKKIDVYKDGDIIASIGAPSYLDYPNYLKKDKALAEKKRKAYKARHEKTRHIKGTNAYYADQILW